MDRHRTRPPKAGSGGCAKSSVSGISVCRFSRRHPVLARRVGQRGRQFADLRPVRHHADQVRGERPVHAGAELCLSVGEPAVTIQQEFLITGEAVLVTGEHAQQRHLRRRRAQPRRIGGAVRLDVRHPPAGKRRHQPAVTDNRVGLVLGAPVLGQEPVIRLDDLRRHQPVEQLLHAFAFGAGRYHESAPQPVLQAGKPGQMTAGRLWIRNGSSGAGLREQR